uniref:Protein kinase domain-containing protein n=1 Tax=viral metagenome TaxID=1070528 RepID=A0A6C0BZ19_9ZZZZ
MAVPSVALQEQLSQKAAKSTLWSDGGYNTIIDDATHPKRLWRISRGTDLGKRERHVEEWETEADLTEALGDANIGPFVYDKLAKDSYLTTRYSRVALSLERYTEDLHSAFFKQWDDEDTETTPWPGYRGNDAEFGDMCGKELLLRFMQLGQLCLLHADLKPENVLVRLHGDKSLSKLCIIDYDPQFMYYGCACLDDLIDKLPEKYQKAASARDPEWKQSLRVSYFCLLNIILMWCWLDYYQDKHGLTRASSKCYMQLSRALAASTFPLDVFSMDRLPQTMQVRLKGWQKRYFGNKSVHATAEKHFKKLRSVSYDWNAGPNVAGHHAGHIAPWPACSPDDEGRCDAIIPIKTTRRKLSVIAAEAGSMTCPQALQNKEPSGLKHKDALSSVYGENKSPLDHRGSYVSGESSYNQKERTKQRHKIKRRASHGKRKFPVGRPHSYRKATRRYSSPRVVHPSMLDATANAHLLPPHSHSLPFYNAIPHSPWAHHSSPLIPLQYNTYPHAYVPRSNSLDEAR